LAALAWLLVPQAGSAAIALQLFSDPRQQISPVAITEDADGFLWLAASQGVFRFDGSHFDKIAGDFEVPAAMAVMGKRAVLIGCNNGVFEYSGGAIQRLSAHPTNTLIRLSDDIVLALHLGTNPAVPLPRWMEAVVVTGAGVRISPVDGIAGWAWLSREGRLSFKCGSHPCSVENSEGLQQAIRGGNLRPYVLDHQKAATGIVIASQPETMANDSFGRYVFRPVFSGLVSVRTVDGAGRDYNVGQFTRVNAGVGLYHARSGGLWVPGDYLYLTEGDSIRKFEAPPLDTIRVNCVFEDSHGGTWFGLEGNGLAVMGKGPVAESWFTPQSLGEITSVVRGGPSNLYATTSKGTLLIRRANEDWRSIDTGNESLKVVHLAPGQDGTLVGLTSVGPPVRLGSAGRLLERMHPPPDMMLSSLRPLMLAVDGSYLIGSMQSTPSLYRIKGSVVEKLSVPGASGNVHDIVADSSGRAWVGYGDGICRIENNACLTAISGADGLLGMVISTLGAGPPDEIWAAYRDTKAFSRFRLVDRRWVARHFSEAEGYSTPQIRFIRRDRRGWVWRGTSSGLFVSDGVHVEPGDWILISDRDGLPSASISRFGFLEDADGSVWIGTERGIAHLNPNPAWFQARGGNITSIAYGTQKFLETSNFPEVFEGPGEFRAVMAAGFLPARYRLLPLDQRWHFSYAGETEDSRIGPGQYELDALGKDGAIARYRFRVVPTSAARLRFILLIAAPAAIAVALIAFLWRRNRQRSRLPPLPDLAAARLAILSPDVHGLVGETMGGRFVPRKLIARGGFGTVFDGADLETGRRCAVKVFNREFHDEFLTARVQDEIAALEVIHHPNVVKMLGHGNTAAGSSFLAMEFIEGQTLRDRLRAGPIPPGVCASFLRQIGSALEAIHALNIFHRDVKPENVMIRSAAPAGAELVLIDFSMAIVKDPDRSLHGLSRAGGTVHYMAPEQALGHASAEADIYSLGKVIVEMLTGTRIAELLPNATLDLAERMRATLEKQTFGLSEASVELVAASMEFDPMRRPKRVREFIDPIARDLECSQQSGTKDFPADAASP
jgi:ligand-binding sensor domain-containing protein